MKFGLQRLIVGLLTLDILPLQAFLALVARTNFCPNRT